MRGFDLFPAYAGVILALGELKNGIGPFPRLRGGDPNREGMQKSRTAFSPPMRG